MRVKNLLLTAALLCSALYTSAQSQLGFTAAPIISMATNSDLDMIPKLGSMFGMAARKQLKPGLSLNSGILIGYESFGEEDDNIEYVHNLWTGKIPVTIQYENNKGTVFGVGVYGGTLISYDGHINHGDKTTRSLDRFTPQSLDGGLIVSIGGHQSHKLYYEAKLMYGFADLSPYMEGNNILWNIGFHVTYFAFNISE